MFDINIALDPVNDGAAFLTKKIIRKDEGSLVIATNGESSILDCDDTSDVLDRLSEVSHGEYMGNTDFMVILNEKKILNVGGGKYFIGSALILKGGEGGLVTLTGDEYEKAAKEFESHLVTLVCDGQEFSAYELV